MRSTRSTRRPDRSSSMAEAITYLRSRTTRKPSAKTLKSCSKSSLFPPRKESPLTPADWELNRGRVELRAAVAAQPTDPEEVGFPSARQIVALKRRVLRGGTMSNESVHIITSHDPEEISRDDLKKLKREYWAIESDFHTSITAST